MLRVPPSVEHILSAAGPIAESLGSRFESRPEQVAMAAAVERAMRQRSHLLVEAGTGVGKSYAYLVPAILRACLHGETVVVATNTIALQEQLVEKDIPMLGEAMEDAGVIPGEESSKAAEQQSSRWDKAHRPLKAVLVKGRGNYVSIRRLQMASQRQDRLFTDAAARRTLHVIEDWASQTLDGTLSTLPMGGLERPGVWDRVQSDSGNCMGRRCPQHGRCFYQRARAEMEGANLLVTNHALFFSDLALRGREAGFLPEYQQVVLDEAHGVEEAAADHFGVSLSEGRVMHLLTSLYHAKTGKGYLPQLQTVGGDAGGVVVDRAVRLVLRAENAARGFFDALMEVQRSGARNGRIREPGIVENTLTPAMRELSLVLGGLREALREEGSEPDRFELNAYALRAEAIAAEADVLIRQTLPGCAYWVEVKGDEEEAGGRGRRGSLVRVTLACSPVEVAPILKEKLFSAKCGVVLTSATLALSGGGGSGGVGEREGNGGAGAFGHTMARLGCEGAETLLLGSPFDHAAQVELFIERSMSRPEGGGRIERRGSWAGRGGGGDELDQRPPEEAEARGAGSLHWTRRGLGSDEGAWPRADGGGGVGGGYNGQLAERILHHLDETDGGAFVLFTSFSVLYAVADLLRPRLEERGMPMFVQGRDGPRGLILRRFRDDERSVLLGAASFWQGVDVRGRGLRNVIITKLPFEPPDRPLTEARCEAIRARGGDPFSEDSLPRAVIRFKQGFGRLIRSRTDRGRVVVLDPRIVTAGYGRRFLAALPEGVRVVER